jgi:hypothetical protein
MLIIELKVLKMSLWYVIILRLKCLIYNQCEFVYFNFLFMEKLFVYNLYLIC